MKNRFAVIMLSVCLLFGTAGCAVTTEGNSSWEVYGGLRMNQDSEKPAKVSVGSTILDRIVDSLTDGEVTEKE